MTNGKKTQIFVQTSVQPSNNFDMGQESIKIDSLISWDTMKFVYGRHWGWVCVCVWKNWKTMNINFEKIK